MTCERCGGLSVPEWSHEAHFSGAEEMVMARCLNCGNRVDGFITVNRQLPPIPGVAPRHEVKPVHRVQALGASHKRA